MLEKRIIKTFLTGRVSATLIIPIELARKHELAEPTHVIIEEKENGILIKKLEIS